MFDPTQPLAIIDVETTGLHPVFNRVIEIGIVRIEQGKIQEEFTSFIDPLVSLPQEITQITGITPKDLHGAPRFEKLAKKVNKLTDNAIFVAHNASFDYSFIKQEFFRMGEEFDRKLLDTVFLSRMAFPGMRHHDLSSIISRLGIKTEKRHRALDDAKVVWEFLQYIQTSSSKSVI